MLVEGTCEETEHLLIARHQGMAPEVDGRVLINDVAVGAADHALGAAMEGVSDAATATGRIVDVEVTDVFADDLVGRIVGMPTAGAGTAAAGGAR